MHRKWDKSPQFSFFSHFILLFLLLSYLFSFFISLSLFSFFFCFFFSIFMSLSARQRWTAQPNGPSIEGPEGSRPTPYADGYQHHQSIIKHLSDNASPLPKHHPDPLSNQPLLSSSLLASSHSSVHDVHRSDFFRFHAYSCAKVSAR